MYFCRHNQSLLKLQVVYKTHFINYKMAVELNIKSFVPVYNPTHPSTMISFLYDTCFPMEEKSKTSI